jgi:DNA-binding winged helix-turn-helix (wHTH) protein
MRVRFGEFTFDGEAREVLRESGPVVLSPKAFQLLAALIESRPKALLKAVLHDLLWPHTFVVEANLSNLIGEIRRGLGDDPQRPSYIRTIHRVGYAFCGNTVETDGARGNATVCRVTWEGGSATLRDGEYIIGRDPAATILLDSPSVSRRHARIHIADGRATFQDLGSKNGSAVEGRRAEGLLALVDGDVITVGLVRLTFHVVRSPVPTESVPLR